MQTIEFSKSGNVVYTIDTDAKTVTAKIKCREEEPQNLFDGQLDRHICGSGLGVVDESDIFPAKFRIKTEYIGKAKCHPDDTFDINFGKMLALERAKQKRFIDMEYKCLLIYDWMKGLLERTKKVYTKQYRQLIDNGIRLHKMLEDLN